MATTEQVLRDCLYSTEGKLKQANKTADELAEALRECLPVAEKALEYCKRNSGADLGDRMRHVEKIIATLAKHDKAKGEG